MYPSIIQKNISCEEFQHDGEGKIDKAGAGVEVTTPALFCFNFSLILLENSENIRILVTVPHGVVNTEW